ncbi:MAG TPA: RluA family pseudouridine synthase [Sandaracinaceae bacterium LLY-WYZ-13_1]|nr:RluA family pseudouridine synthase [Sandaracinaceae bacterium LLY-WYZ-13_1]
MSFDLRVGEDDDGVRLDVVLVRRVDGMSRAKARRMIHDGLVRLNGRRPRKGTRLANGDRIELREMPRPSDFVPAPSPELPLEVVHEDDAVVVVEKPAGLPTHPLRPHERETLANALLARYPEMEGVGYALREPGILHRLDNDTSGLLVAARDAAAFEALRAALRAARIDKRYRALVDGRLEGPTEVDVPIAPHPTDPRRVHPCVDEADRRLPAARAARTEILEARLRRRTTLLEVRATVAVRHQIRAHLASLGHPLVGDWLYGGSMDALSRHFLHASYVGFAHPGDGRPVEVRSALPPELARVLDDDEDDDEEGRSP